MPDELTDYAKELIQKCPQLINLFAEKINRMINNWDHEEIKPEPIDDLHIIYTGDMQELIAHVGYDEAQCGYDK